MAIRILPWIERGGHGSQGVTWIGCCSAGDRGRCSSFAAPLVISDAWIGPTGQAADIVEGEDVAVAGRDEQLALIAGQRPHRCHARVDQRPQ